jgi:phospholipase C
VPEPWQSPISRRGFLAGAAALALPSLGAPTGLARSFGASKLPRPDRSGLEHVVVVMMENRSFDHLLGWVPHADGKQAGLTFTDRQGVAHRTFRLAPDYAGCAYHDPDHSHEGGLIQYNDGKCDGFLRSGASDVFAIGYYTAKDLPFLGKAALYWTVCDRYFCSIMAPTQPNRLYLHTGGTDRTVNDWSHPPAGPTIWDRLAAGGLRGRYYHFRPDVSVLRLWGDKYARITRSGKQFLADCRAGRLPHVAFVDPYYSDADTGYGNDDHPHGDVRAGESFLNEIYRAVTSSPAWRRTLLVITFDEWGGFFDHVPPPRARDVDPAYSVRGFRVPCLLISPFARRRYVAHGTYDHASILRLIEWRWGLEPLSVRDAHAKNLAAALDFSRHDLRAPRFAVPPFPLRAVCTP